MKLWREVKKSKCFKVGDSVRNTIAGPPITEALKRSKKCTDFTVCN